MSAEADPELESGRSPRLVWAWDFPTRLFHWTLVALIVLAYVSRNYSSDPTLYWHRINGYAVLVLILFRTAWGFVGSSTSRFASFVPRPGPTFRYGAAFLRRRAPRFLGHNPLGSIVILALLLAVAVQAVAGLFTTDDVLAEGPLYRHAPEWLTARMGQYHARGFWMIMALAAIHIAANVGYQLFGKDRLIAAMVTGRKPSGDYVDGSEAVLASGLRGLLWLLLAIVIVIGGVELAGDSVFR